MNGKTIYYAIKIGDEYMQGIEPNENYCRSGTAPTMGQDILIASLKVFGDMI